MLVSKSSLIRVYKSKCFAKFSFKKNIINEPNLIIFHPQTIGYQSVIDIFQKRRFTWMYVLDNSIFCKKSYNFIEGKNRPCLKCVGGEFDNSEINECSYFPVPQNVPNGEFESQLMLLSKDAKIGFLTQSESQAKLLYSHLGANAIIKTVGMKSDFDEIDGINLPPENWQEKNIDLDNTIIYHGDQNEAKGFNWTLQLMQYIQSSGKIIFFPLEERYIPEEYKSYNYIAEPVNWENGLKWLVGNCGLTLCPSLWSAPIEGALIKSLKYSRSTAVVQNSTSFSSQIPDDIVHKLDQNPIIAAMQVLNLPKLDKKHINIWMQNFNHDNDNFMRKIIECVVN